MEVHLSLQSPAIIWAFLIIILVISLILTRRKNNRKEAPKAGGAWPLIGHFHLIAGSEPIQSVLGTMADKYGPIFTVRIGLKQALVVSNYEIARECFTTNDKAFASRPKTVARELLGYNFLFIASSPYGNYWRQSRKIITIELLSNHRLQSLKHVRESEVKASIKELFMDSQRQSSGSDNNATVEMKDWLHRKTFDIILRLIAGKRFTSEECSDLQEQAANFLALFGTFVLADAFPFLRRLDIGRNEVPMKKTAKKFDIILQKWLDEHKMKRASGQAKGDGDFIYVMLSLLEEDANLLPDGDANTVIKAICLTLIIAAGDTTSVSLTWAISLLLNNRDVLKKAQEELDIQVGRNRQVDESDLKNLVYLQAIIKETTRLYPAAPILVPHESIEDCTVSGYHVPAGTQLFVNAWKIHHDPRVWEEPCKFKPERFLTTQKDIDFRGQNFELIPFGSGRRMCPGISFGIQVMQLLLSSLLHGFDFATPNNEPVDMKVMKSTTLAKASPLEVIFTPRLSTSLYG